MYRRITLCLACLCLAAFCSGRDFSMINLVQSSGLPSNIVYDIYQDEAGCMWFATDKGISRYDGIKFRNFTTSDGLPDNDCFFFRKDHFGRLWIGNYTGKLVFYQNGVFHSADNTAFLNIPTKMGNTSANIIVEKDSSLTITFSDKSAFVSVKGQRTTVFDLSKSRSLSTAAIVDIRYEGPDAFRLIYYDHEILVNRKLELIRKIRTGKRVTHHLVGRDDEFYLSDNGILSLDYQPLKNISAAFLKQNAINRVFRDKNDVFICTNHGIRLGDSTEILKNINVTTVFIDREKNYWISTSGNGVYKLNRNFRDFDACLNCYSSKVVFAQKLKDRLIFSTLNKNVYMMQGQHIYCIYNFEQENNLMVKSPNIGHFILDDAYYNYSSEQVFSIKRLSEPRPLTTKALYLPGVRNVNSVFVTDSRIILKGRRGVFYRKYDQHISLKWIVPEWQYIKTSNDPASNTVYGGALDGQNMFWFSTLDGVYRFDGTKVEHQAQLGKYVFKEMIFLGPCLIAYTLNNKLLISRDYDRPSATIDSGIKNNCVWDRFYRLDDSSVLITTNDDYRLLKISKGAVYSISILENQFVPQLADYVYSDGATSYFFSNQSVFRIPNKALLNTDAPPGVQLTGLKTAKTTYPPDSVLQLSFNESRDISIYYSVRSLNTDKVSCEYSISNSQDGFSNKWVTTNTGSINFLKIGYGQYEVRLRAKTYGGSYSEIKKIRLIIEKPFWLNGWWISLLVLIVSGTFIVAIRYTIRRKTLEKEKEIKFLKSEFTALNALMNPHFIFNSLNSVQSLINRNDKRAASEYIRTVSDLIRQNMYNISNDLIPLEKEMALVSNYLKLEKLRFKEALNYEINIDASVETELIMIPPLLIQPLVENAIKHGIRIAHTKEGMLRIDIYPAANFNSVMIDITDNGKGLGTAEADNAGHQPSALKNIAKRLEQLSLIHKVKFRFSIGNIADDSGRIMGVKATIEIFE